MRPDCARWSVQKTAVNSVLMDLVVGVFKLIFKVNGLLFSLVVNTVNANSFRIIFH